MLAAAAYALAAILSLPTAAAETPPTPPPDPTSVTVDIGTSRVNLPGPAGWVELTANREILRTVIESALPDGNRHLATFTTPEIAALVDSGEDMSQWASAITLRAFEQRSMSAAEFLQFRLYIRSQWDQVVEQARQRVKEAQQKASERVQEKLGVDFETSVGALESLGVFLDEPGAVGALMTMESGGSFEGESRNAEMSVAVVMLHLHSRLVVLGIYRIGTSPDDLEVAKATALAWKDAVRAANAGTSQPAM